MRDHSPRSNEVTLVGPDPAAVGGVSSYTAMLLSALGGRSAKHLNVWSPGHTQSSGWGWRDVVYHLVLMGRVARQARRVAVVHVMVTSLPVALIRELSLILIVRLNGGNVLGHFHGSLFGIQAKRSRSYRRILLMTLRAVSGGVVLSETMRRDFQTLSPSTAKKIAVLENPVAEIFFATPASTYEPGPFRILCLGEISDNKGQLQLMKAVDHIVEPVQLVLAGPVAPLVKKKFEDALAQSPHTRYVGTVKGESLLELFHTTDCYCLFSSSEAMPISILEAMATGLPVVATSVGAIPNVVTSDIGMIIAPRDQAALVEALDLLRSDLVRRTSMGARAKLKARQRFSLADHMAKLSVIYDGIAETA